MTIPKFSSIDFKKSSLCETPATCVEVAFKDDMVAVRDSKNPGHPPLCFSKEEWKMFVAGVKNKEFDY